MKTALVHFNHTFTGSQTTWPSMKTSNWKPNYGDMLVCAALIRQVELGDTVRVGFPRTLDEPVSRALIRGSTYMHNEFDFEGANQTLDSIDAPALGIGPITFGNDACLVKLAQCFPTTWKTHNTKFPRYRKHINAGVIVRGHAQLEQYA